jgi:DNA anti-recombination protein RmuC
MSHEERLEFTSTDSHSAPETANIRERVRKLREEVSQLSEALETVQKNLRKAAGETESE